MLNNTFINHTVAVLTSMIETKTMLSMPEMTLSITLSISTKQRPLSALGTACAKNPIRM